MSTSKTEHRAQAPTGTHDVGRHETSSPAAVRRRPDSTVGWVLLALAVVVGAVSAYVAASTLVEQLLTTDGAFSGAELVVRLGLSALGLVLAAVADRLARPRSTT
jgi:hypothetical protein